MEALHLGYSFADYVRFERDAHERHEFVRGMILAMAGGSLEHGRLTAAVITALGSQLRGRRCSAFDSNARVRVAASGNAYYPDASVVCGRLEVDPEDGRSMLNPSVLVEVLSPSTAEYDRSDKLLDYQRIASLEHVVHLKHDAPGAVVWTRTSEGWQRIEYGMTDVIALTAIACTLDIAELYRNPLAT